MKYKRKEVKQRIMRLERLIYQECKKENHDLRQIERLEHNLATFKKKLRPRQLNK